MRRFASVLYLVCLSVGSLAKCQADHFQRVPAATGINGTYMRSVSSPVNSSSVLLFDARTGAPGPGNGNVPDNRSANGGNGAPVGSSASGYTTLGGSIVTESTNGSLAANPDLQKVADVSAIQLAGGSVMLLDNFMQGFCRTTIRSDADCSWDVVNDENDENETGVVKFTLDANWSDANGPGIFWNVGQAINCTLVHPGGTFTLTMTTGANGTITDFGGSAGWVWATVPPMRNVPQVFHFTNTYSIGRFRFHGGLPTTATTAGAPPSVDVPPDGDSNPRYTWLNDDTQIGPVWFWTGITTYAGSISSTATLSLLP